MALRAAVVVLDATNSMKVGLSRKQKHALGDSVAKRMAAERPGPTNTFFAAHLASGASLGLFRNTTRHRALHLYLLTRGRSGELMRAMRLDHGHKVRARSHSRSVSVSEDSRAISAVMGRLSGGAPVGPRRPDAGRDGGEAGPAPAPRSDETGNPLRASLADTFGWDSSSSVFELDARGRQATGLSAIGRPAPSKEVSLYDLRPAARGCRQRVWRMTEESGPWNWAVLCFILLSGAVYKLTQPQRTAPHARTHTHARAHIPRSHTPIRTRVYRHHGHLRDGGGTGARARDA